MLTLIKLVHTIAWAFFVTCIAGIFVAAHADRFQLALLCIAAVTVESVVLVANRMHCPLTPLAARYTTNRDPNFDIFLPRWLAQYNKEVFGSLFVAGIAYTALRWAF